MELPLATWFKGWPECEFDIDFKLPITFYIKPISKKPKWPWMNIEPIAGERCVIYCLFWFAVVEEIVARLQKLGHSKGIYIPVNIHRSFIDNALMFCPILINLSNYRSVVWMYLICSITCHSNFTYDNVQVKTTCVAKLQNTCVAI